MQGVGPLPNKKLEIINQLQLSNSTISAVADFHTNSRVESFHHNDQGVIPKRQTQTEKENIHTQICLVLLNYPPIYGHPQFNSLNDSGPWKQDSKWGNSINISNFLSPPLIKFILCVENTMNSKCNTLLMRILLA